jgi:acyl carrier protein
MTLDTRLQEIVQDVLGDDDLDLNEGTSAADVEGWDSLAHINIMVAVESAYGVTFTTDQLGQFRNLGELQDFLRQRA